MSIGSDAVEAALELRETGAKTGKTLIEQISEHYGRHAVVISVDPKRVWVADPKECKHTLCQPPTARDPAGEASIVPSGG